MRIFRNVFMLVSLVALSSCKKFLEKAPDTSYAYPTTVSNLQAILDNPVLNQSTPSYAEASADDYYLDLSKYNSLDDNGKKVYVWDFPPTTAINDWAECYANIYVANVAINQIDKIASTATNRLDWNNVKGAGYFFRAYYFLHLLWTFSKSYDIATSETDLGIVLRKTTDVNEPSVRATVKSSYQQVIDDANTAIQFLPNLPNHPLRPSKAAAYALLARTYLSMGDYENALINAELCLAIKSDLLDYNGDSDLIGNLNQIQSPFRIYNRETIFYSQNTILFPNADPRNAFIDTFLYSTYSQDDLRREAFFSQSGTSQKFKGTYAQNSDVLFSGIATDEVLLIRAECLARLGSKEAALRNLDTLLEKRWKKNTFIKSTATTNEEAIKKILLERRKELVMRDLRWIDIKRLNRIGAGIEIKRIIGSQEYKLSPNDNKFALPLPVDIIQLTGMPQNPR